MRAILIVPDNDDEGLTEDRLKNGRYGLTNKPALTQQNIAGSLQASFKAGQNVTLGNLRSLNKKLQEAQKALDNANGNIDKSEETQDKIDDAVNEATDLLSNNIWERWWQGTLGKGREDSDKQLFALKFMEDEFNKLRAGEPGNPVISTGGIMSTAPLPRVCYWDPIFSINSHTLLALDADTLAFLVKDYAILIQSSDATSKITQAMTVTTGLLSTLLGIFGTLVAISNDPDIIILKKDIIESMVIIGIVNSATLTVLAMIIALQTAKLKELGGTSGRGSFYKSTAPKTYTDGTWKLCLYIDPTVGSAINVVNTTLSSIITMSLTITILVATAQVLSVSSIPGAMAIARALFKVALALNKVVNEVTGKIITIDLITIMLQISLFITSRNNGKPAYLVPELLTKPQAPKAVLEDGSMWGQSGVLGQLYDELDGGAFQRSMTQIAKYVSLSGLIGPLIGALTQKISGLFIGKLLITEYNKFESAIIIEGQSDDYKDFEDWFGLSRPVFSWNYNLKDYGSINAGSFPGENWETDHFEAHARVYPGFVLDRNAASKVFQGKTITRSVVIRQKFTTTNGFVYYGYMLLGEVSGKLYLVYERNCVYNRSYRATTVRHAEQLIVNSGIFDGEPTAYFTYDRRGQLSYMYVDFEDGVRAQYRPLKSAKENWLEGELINTEYDWNNYTVLTRSPSNGNTEGYINSYADQ